MSVAKAVDILERKRRLEQAPALYLVTLRDALLALAVLLSAWFGVPRPIQNDLIGLLIAISVIIIYQNFRMAQIRRRVEVAELKLLVIERSQEKE